MTDLTPPALAEQAPRRRQNGRSPSYPSVSLPRAIERAQTLYRAERQYATPVASVMKHWGYSTANGPGGLSLAAMKKFGLLTDEGVKTDRRVQLTDLAVQILNHPSSKAREDAIKTAALIPVMHQDLWDQYKNDLPSDANLIWILTKDRGFTETGATEFVKEYRETLEFAKLSDDLVDVDEDEGFDGEDRTGDLLAQRDNPGSLPPTGHDAASRAITSSAAEPPAGAKSVSVPMPNGPSVTLSGPFPINEVEWHYMMAVLTAMKPGLVEGSGWNVSEISPAEEQ